MSRPIGTEKSAAVAADASAGNPSLRDFARWVAAGVVVVGTGVAARVGSGRLCFKREGCPDCPAFTGCERPKAATWRARQEGERS